MSRSDSTNEETWNQWNAQKRICELEQDKVHLNKTLAQTTSGLLVALLFLILFGFAWGISLNIITTKNERIRELKQKLQAESTEKESADDTGQSLPTN